MKETVECEFYLRVRGVKIGSVSEGFASVEGYWDSIEWSEEFDSAGVIGSCGVIVRSQVGRV